MLSDNLSRRDFTRLSLAALGGAAAGSMLSGCSDSSPPPTAETKTDPAPKPTTQPTTAAENPLLSEPHVCRGLNTCKDHGTGGDNACAGQGACASVMAHSCRGGNECKGQGGCGEHPGENACKGQGKCAVPLGDGAWARARQNFEAAMTDAGKKVGAAPEQS